MICVQTFREWLLLCYLSFPNVSPNLNKQFCIFFTFLGSFEFKIFLQLNGLEFGNREIDFVKAFRSWLLLCYLSIPKVWPNLKLWFRIFSFFSCFRLSFFYYCMDWHRPIRTHAHTCTHVEICICEYINMNSCMHTRKYIHLIHTHSHARIPPEYPYSR